jgi:diacylglycerol kinase family enzyme
MPPTAPAPETALDRAEELAESILPTRTPKRRMLVIVNPYASTVSDRLKNLVVYALQGRYEVDAIDTQAKAHATELCREAADEGYDVVVAFGGDGTVNEAANGLVGSDTPLSALPGGSTNVFCRSLGIPNDVVDATEHLLGMADRFEPSRVDLGVANDRFFTFAAGVGLDASVVEQVDRHPALKARLSEWYFTGTALTTFAQKYLIRAPRVIVEAGGHEIEGVTVIVQNSDPYTYFSNHPIRVCIGAGNRTGTLSAAVLKRATPFEVPTIIARIFAGGPDSVSKHAQVEPLTDLRDLRIVSKDGRRFPLQLDGDHVGDVTQVELGVRHLALPVVS